MALVEKLIEKIWFDDHPLGCLAAPILWPLSQLFGFVARRRRRAYLDGVNGAYRAPIPVIVVGNITVGGNGKTPVVIWLVEQLTALGMKPGVVSRGYGGKGAAYPLVLNEKTSTKMAGDEPVLIFERTGAPVAISPRRAEAVKALLPLGVDIIITDDGLQHYQLARDIEFVVIDGERRFGNGYYLPRGPLREPIERLHTVDFMVCNGATPGPMERGMTLQPSQLVNLTTGKQAPASAFSNVVAMAGIGYPPRFFNTLLSLGITLKQCASFADHHAYSLDELEGLASKSTPLLMTEKDAVKCRILLRQRPDIDNWWYLPVDAQFSQQDTADIINIIKKVKESYGSPTA